MGQFTHLGILTPDPRGARASRPVERAVFRSVRDMQQLRNRIAIITHNSNHVFAASTLRYGGCASAGPEA